MAISQEDLKKIHVLEGLPEIAKYMRKDRSTIWRWIQDGVFPATKLPNGNWFTTKYAIALWVFAGHGAQMEAVKQVHEAGYSVPGPHIFDTRFQSKPVFDKTQK